MVKVRLHGEYEEVTEFAKLLERVPTVKVMSRSDGYPDRGKSVYERVYIDAKIVPEPSEEKREALDDLIESLYLALSDMREGKLKVLSVSKLARAYSIAKQLYEYGLADLSEVEEFADKTTQIEV